MTGAESNKTADRLLREQIAQQHRRFAPAAEPKEENDEEGGGNDGLTPDADFLLPHPLLAQSQQFSGELDSEDSPLPSGNPDARKEHQLQMQQKLDKKLQAERQFNPTPSGKM